MNDSRHSTTVFTQHGVGWARVVCRLFGHMWSPWRQGRAGWIVRECEACRARQVDVTRW